MSYRRKSPMLYISASLYLRLTLSLFVSLLFPVPSPPHLFRLLRLDWFAVPLSPPLYVRESQCKKDREPETETENNKVRCW